MYTLSIARHSHVPTLPRTTHTFIQIGELTGLQSVFLRQLFYTETTKRPRLSEHLPTHKLDPQVSPDVSSTIPSSTLRLGPLSTPKSVPDFPPPDPTILHFLFVLNLSLLCHNQDLFLSTLKFPISHFPLDHYYPPLDPLSITGKRCKSLFTQRSLKLSSNFYKKVDEQNTIYLVFINPFSPRSQTSKS